MTLATQINPEEEEEEEEVVEAIETVKTVEPVEPVNNVIKGKTGQFKYIIPNY